MLIIYMAACSYCRAGGTVKQNSEESSDLQGQTASLILQIIMKNRLERVANFFVKKSTLHLDPWILNGPFSSLKLQVGSCGRKRSVLLGSVGGTRRNSSKNKPAIRNRAGDILL